MLVVASKGGAPTNPDWYHNLEAHPRFEVEVGTETFTGRRGGARPRPSAPSSGPRIVAERPGFGDYETKTTRVMPVFRLRRPPSASGAGLRAPASGCCAGCAPPRRARAPRAAAAGTSRPGRGSPCAGRTSRRPGWTPSGPTPRRCPSLAGFCSSALPSGTQSPCSRSHACRSSIDPGVVEQPGRAHLADQLRPGRRRRRGTSCSPPVPAASSAPRGRPSCRCPLMAVAPGSRWSGCSVAASAPKRHLEALVRRRNPSRS